MLDDTMNRPVYGCFSRKTNKLICQEKPIFSVSSLELVFTLLSGN